MIETNKLTFLLQVILRIPNNVFDSGKFIERQLSAHGGHKTKLLAMEDAIEFLMVLPGEIAKETRAKFANIIRRYLAGDKSLIEEINANSASSSPIAQLARGGAPSAVEAASSFGWTEQEKAIGYR